MHGSMVGERVKAEAAVSRVVLNLRICFCDAVAAVTLKRAPGPEKAVQDLREAVESAAQVGDVSFIVAGAAWWATAQALVRQWLIADEHVRRDTAPAVDAVLRVVSLWQDGLIGLPQGKDGPGVN